MPYRNETEVEINLLRPLFTDILGYPSDDLEWRRSVDMQFGREKVTKEADLLAKHHGEPVVTVEAKHPTEAVQRFIGQLDSYAFNLQTPYSVITNGRRFILRGYYSFNSRINVIDESVDELEHDRWKKLRSLISFDNILATMREPSSPVRAPDEEKIKDYRRFFRKIHNAIRDRDKLDPGAAFDELSKLLFLKAAEDEWRQRSQSMPVLTREKIQEWESLGKGTARRLVNEWFSSRHRGTLPGRFRRSPADHTFR